jgi:hypothetical protein
VEPEGKQEHILNRMNQNSFSALQVEVLWVVTPCSVMVGYQRFGRSCCHHLQGEVKSHHNTTRHHNPQDLCLNLHRRENPKSRQSRGGGGRRATDIPIFFNDHIILPLPQSITLHKLQNRLTYGKKFEVIPVKFCS